MLQKDRFREKIGIDNLKKLWYHYFKKRREHATVKLYRRRN